MFKSIVRVLGWFIVVSNGFMGYMAFNSYYITLDDVEKVEGVLDGTPTYTRDEYDTYNTGMHFHLKEHKNRFGVPGKLLAKSALGIQDLKDGDAVDVYVQKVEGKSFLPRRLTFSIAKRGQPPLINIKEAIAFFTSPKFIWIAIFFWGMGLAIIWWLIRPRKVKMTNLKP